MQFAGAPTPARVRRAPRSDRTTSPLRRLRRGRGTRTAGRTSPCTDDVIAVPRLQRPCQHDLRVEELEPGREQVACGRAITDRSDEREPRSGIPDPVEPVRDEGGLCSAAARRRASRCAAEPREVAVERVRAGRDRAGVEGADQVHRSRRAVARSAELVGGRACRGSGRRLAADDLLALGVRLLVDLSRRQRGRTWRQLHEVVREHVAEPVEAVAAVPRLGQEVRAQHRVSHCRVHAVVPPKTHGRNIAAESCSPVAAQPVRSREGKLHGGQYRVGDGVSSTRAVHDARARLVLRGDGPEPERPQHADDELLVHPHHPDPVGRASGTRWRRCRSRTTSSAGSMQRSSTASASAVTTAA
jgi:hypothetical protein